MPIISQVERYFEDNTPFLIIFEKDLFVGEDLCCPKRQLLILYRQRTELYWIDSNDLEEGQLNLFCVSL